VNAIVPNNPAPASVILGSQSPQRLELLSRLLPTEAIRVIPPLDGDESNFHHCSTMEAIDARLLEIVRTKTADVRLQATQGVVLTADTVIVGFDARDCPQVLGKPPEESPAFEETVRNWFRDYYRERPHLAKTAVMLSVPGRDSAERIVTTEVRFEVVSLANIEWYIATGEPRGKAGGYAIQGAGSLFVSEVHGSLSNVVGLPLRETREMLIAAEVVSSQ
jgi:septum formation protein